MADIFDNESSKLLCDESNDLCFDDDSTIIDYDGIENLPLENHNQGSVFNRSSSERGGGGGPCLPIQSDEYFDVLIEKEIEYLPKDDYLMRLRSGELELSIRREAFDWISKAHAHYNFGPISFCLSINYLDRFLSACDLPEDKSWGVQLLAVACLSIAIKMEETDTPPNIELQVGEPRFLFEAKTIQRMELLVLSTLRWKMSAITPCSYIDFFITKINHVHHQQSLHTLLNRSLPLILSTTRGIDFLEFKPSEIAAAVAMSVTFSGEAKQIQPVNVDDDAISFFTHLQKGRVVKCMELIKDLSHMSVNLANGTARSGSISGLLPYSPIGVLDGAACFSYKSGGCDDSLALGSCVPNSSTSTSPVTKRMKLDPKPSQEQPPPPPV